MKKIYSRIALNAEMRVYKTLIGELPEFAQKELRGNGYIVREVVSSDEAGTWAILLGD